jgi:hypothetical protein
MCWILLVIFASFPNSIAAGAEVSWPTFSLKSNFHHFTAEL